MSYINPVLRGFYPDPSVCAANGKYYMVNSSFQFFPGVPLHESEDLVNWKPIGHVLTRPSQLPLGNADSRGGIYAPTIRYHDGRFYMVTTNVSGMGNFYVWTDDIYGQWSEPIKVEQGGIDPSLLFENGKTYFISNGVADDGTHGITQCEIDIETGRKLTPSVSLWQGTGGRYLEGPHMYHIGDTYWLMAAEGGTEYGHMITCAKSGNVWGPFTACPVNPVVTNRNKAPHQIQGIGHGDLVWDKNGDMHILSLGFRQLDDFKHYHVLGRETMLMPARFENGSLIGGTDGTVDTEYSYYAEQKLKREWTIENTRWDADWSFLRNYDPSAYELTADRAVLYGRKDTLSGRGVNTFVALRQKDMDFILRCKVKNEGGEGGITVYAGENEHLDIGAAGGEIFLRFTVAGLENTAARIPASGDITLIVKGEPYFYRFFAEIGGAEIFLGRLASKYVSTEVADGFVGVMLGLYAQDGGKTEFTDFRLTYK